MRDYLEINRANSDDRTPASTSLPPRSPPRAPSLRGPGRTSTTSSPTSTAHLRRWRDDPREDRLLAVEYPYTETEDPVVWDDASTYASAGEGGDARIEATVTHEWNHGMGEIFTSLTDHGMRITAFEEHDCVPWRALGDQTEAHLDHPGEFRLADRPERLPASYTLRAVRED